MAYTIGLGPIARKGVEVQLLSWAHLETGSRLARRGGGRGEQIERCDRQKFEPFII